MKNIMKSRTITLALMVSSLFVMAASSQARADKIGLLTEVVLQDDTSGSFLLIDVKSGAYKFHDCTSGFAMGGSVKVNFKGCTGSVNDESEGRLIVAEIDMCSGQARAYLMATCQRAFPLLNSCSQVTDGTSRSVLSA